MILIIIVSEWWWKVRRELLCPQSNTAATSGQFGVPTIEISQIFYCIILYKTKEGLQIDETLLCLISLV